MLRKSGGGLGSHNSLRSTLWPLRNRLFGEVKIISQPLPCDDLVNAKARFAVCQRREEQEAPEHDGQNHECGDPATKQALGSNTLTDGPRTRPPVALHGSSCWLCLRLDRLDVKDEFDKGTCHEGRS